MHKKDKYSTYCNIFITNYSICQSYLLHYGIINNRNTTGIMNNISFIMIYKF